MTQPIGTPDWVKSVPGGTHKLLDTTINAGVADYQSPLMSCLAYSGLYLEAFFTGPGGTYMQVRAEFYDDPNGINATTSTFAVAAQNNNMELNLPVLGPYVKLHLVSSGGATITAARILVIGHNGGPGANVRAAQSLLAENDAPGLASFAGKNVSANTICEGPATLMFTQLGSQPGVAQVFMADSAGATHTIARSAVAGNFQGVTVGFWLPPQPISVSITNIGNAADHFLATVIVGRS